MLLCFFYWVMELFVECSVWLVEEFDDVWW